MVPSRRSEVTPLATRGVPSLATAPPPSGASQHFSIPALEKGFSIPALPRKRQPEIHHETDLGCHPLFSRQLWSYGLTLIALL
eukprot:6820295-Prymnesium_polylepis.1